MCHEEYIAYAMGRGMEAPYFDGADYDREFGQALEAKAAQAQAAAEAQATSWIEATTGVSFNAMPFGDMLKDGLVLCNLLNAIRPGAVSPPSISSVPFKQKENVSAFLRGCSGLGVGADDCFEIVDLYEQKDLGAVVQCLVALGTAVQQTCPEFAGPHFGEGKGEGVGGGEGEGEGVGGGKGKSEEGKAAPPAPAAALPTPSDEGAPLQQQQKQLEKQQHLQDLQQQQQQQQQLCIEWIESVTGVQFKSEPFGDMLKDGTVLCELVNAITRSDRARWRR